MGGHQPRTTKIRDTAFGTKQIKRFPPPVHRLFLNIRTPSNCFTDLTRSGSSMFSTTWTIRSTNEPVRETPVERSWTQSCEATFKIPDVWTTFLYQIGSSYHFTGLSWNVVFSQAESAVRNEDKLASVRLWIRGTSRCCLQPHNSISNVLVSLTMHDNIYIFIFIRDVAKNMKPLWKVKGSFNRTSWKLSDL